MDEVNTVQNRFDKNLQFIVTDGSKIITEALVSAGADVYVGYPITPSNWFYAYAKKRFPSFYAAPDEISVMQWMTGFSATGKIPVSATSFPGLALMAESLNMAYMMELPMVLIVSQRLGPSTGSATTGAQGDLTFINGLISGGYPLPVFCPSNFEDCLTLAKKSVEIALKLRTPVILLTSKEMVMTNRRFDISRLKPTKPLRHDAYRLEGPYKSYQAGKNMVPPFVPLGHTEFQVRMNASTHDNEGLIRNGHPESLENTLRLQRKIEEGMKGFTHYELDDDKDATTLLVSYGISSNAARDALLELRSKGEKAGLLVVKTLIPVAEEIMDVLDRYKKLVFIEENLSGQLKELIFGKRKHSNIKGVNKVGSMITPEEVLEKVI